MLDDVTLQRMEVRDGTGFGEAIALAHPDPQPLLDRCRQLGAQRRGAAKDGHECAQVIARHHRVLGEGDHNGRDDIGEGDAVIL